MANTISGRVILKESGAGIPDLLVVLYDKDPGTKSEDALREAPPPIVGHTANDDGDRIGSVLTGSDGRFKLIFEDAEFQIRNAQERRPDLLIKVLAPEEPGISPEAEPLYIAKAIRENAGRTEEYLIRLTTDQLAKASLTPPSLLPPDVETAKTVVGRLVEARAQTEALTDGTLAVARQRVDAHRTRFASYRDQFQPALLKSLSGVAVNLIEPSRFVAAGESPFVKNSAVMQQGIRDTINSANPAKRAPSAGFLTLTDEQAQKLQNEAAPDGSVDAAALAEATGQSGAAPATTLRQRPAVLSICMPQTAAQRCATSALNEASNGGGNPSGPDPIVPSGEVTAVGTDDIPRFLARLLNPMTAPEEELLTGMTPAATRDSVQASVRTLDFQPSPADVPAYHDFNNLQIAFQHVWQEAIDAGALQLAQDAYETIVELGGNPSHPDHNGLPPVRALQVEAGLSLRALRSAAAPVVRDHRGGDSGPDSDPGGGVVVTGGPRPPRR